MNRAIAFICVTFFILVLSFLRTMDGGAPMFGTFSSTSQSNDDSETVKTTKQMANTPSYIVPEDRANPYQSGSRQVVLRRGPDSHFRATVKINGVSIDTLVDSGASVVALSQRDAERIGMFTSQSDFTETAQGAGGAIQVKPVVFDRIALGDIEKTQIEGVIIGGDANQSLLGQSFLRQLGGVTIEGDTMTIR